jgi:ribosomal protein L7/L12
MPGEYSQEALRRHFENTNQRLAAIEEQLKLLSESVGIPYSTFSEEQEVPDEVVQLAAAGKKLDAVKRYRELTGADADRARDVIAGL